MAKPEKETRKTPPVEKKNIMDIALTDSKGRKIKMSGPCTDREIKAIGKAINHSEGQKVEIK